MNDRILGVGRDAPAKRGVTRIALLVRRSEAFYRDGVIDPSAIVRDPAKAAKVNAGIEWWDQTFWLSYREFRLALRELAAPLHGQAGFDEVIPWQDERAVHALAPGTCLVPVDEDDWLSPDLCERLASFCAGTRRDVVTWDVVRKSADGTALLNPNAFVESCGYAVRLPFGWTPICNHMHLRPPERPALSEALSLRNETPASMAFLYKSPPGHALVALRQALADTGDAIPTAFREVWGQYQRLLARLLASRCKPRT